MRFLAQVAVFGPNARPQEAVLDGNPADPKLSTKSSFREGSKVLKMHLFEEDKCLRYDSPCNIVTASRVQPAQVFRLMCAELVLVELFMFVEGAHAVYWADAGSVFYR